ncbi:hypothetical protein NDI47_25540 [Microcoleus vaginatus GB1-A2]|uniref:hypothetical protein n=1 Tax=Microcoleus vaginatus TaxID=119532 RepID=UPI001682B76B|nr:hypothetical protein [Microcoleus sp. FACHB-61]
MSQEEFGYWWPLTVPRGKLACFRSENLEVIYFAAPDGKEYKLKGGSALRKKSFSNSIYPQAPPKKSTLVHGNPYSDSARGEAVSFDGKSLLLTSAQSRQKDVAIIAEVISQNPGLAKV